MVGINSLNVNNAYAQSANVYTVLFDSNGGSFIEGITVNANQKIQQPQTPTKGGSKNIFNGWYYNNELWDFNNDIVKSSITLTAQWVGIECNNWGDINQNVDNIKTLKFTINYVVGDVYWYVNDSVKSSSNTLIFTPEQKVANYEIYCVANGVKSNVVDVVIDYAEPVEIETILDRVSGNVYLFKLKGGDFYNPENIIWFKTLDKNTKKAEKLGTGSTCLTSIKSDCYVYAVYNGQITSNKYEVITEGSFGIEMYITIGAVALAITTVVILLIISKKRYNNIY